MDLVSRNEFIYNLMKTIYTQSRSFYDFIHLYGVSIDDDNYRKLSMATALYYSNWLGINHQQQDSFIRYLKQQNFVLGSYISRQINVNGNIQYENPLEQFVSQFIA